LRLLAVAERGGLDAILRHVPDQADSFEIEVEMNFPWDDDLLPAVTRINGRAAPLSEHLRNMHFYNFEPEIALRPAAAGVAGFWLC
jgi:hypothetical protein